MVFKIIFVAFRTEVIFEILQRCKKLLVWMAKFMIAHMCCLSMNRQSLIRKARIPSSPTVSSFLLLFTTSSSVTSSIEKSRSLVHFFLSIRKHMCCKNILKISIQSNEQFYLVLFFVKRHKFFEMRVTTAFMLA